MALKEMAVPESPKLYTKKYEGLLGVDYSCDITEVDKRRTPTGLNMISDEGANPVKRLGWRVVKRLRANIGGSLLDGAGKILKIVTKDGIEPEHGEYEMPDLWAITELAVFYLHHPSDEHYSTGYTVTQKYGISDLNDENTQIKGCVTFPFNGSLYCILSSKGGNALGMYMLWNGDVDSPDFTRVDQQATAYIPETTIGIAPNGTGGTSLEPINMFSPSMMFSFCADGEHSNFYLYPENIRNNPDKQYILRDTLKVEVLGENGWTEETHISRPNQIQKRGLDLYGNPMAEDVWVMSSWFQFQEGYRPSASSTGADNVRVTFTPFNMTLSDVPWVDETHDTMYPKGLYRDTINDLLTSTVANIYGHTKPDRIFLAGGKTKNRVYYSQVNNATYFPDNNYIEVGHDDNDIVALQRVSDYLAVLKGYTTLDNTMYMVKGSYLDESMYFMVVPTSVTVPAVAPQAAENLLGEPLFLSNLGVFGITSIYATEEKTIRNRSKFIDRKLLKEEHLENACATVWNKYYVLCVNTHCYVLDGRKTTSDSTGNTNFNYEAYYWENIPAITFATFKKELYFGTEDSQICKFNTDVEDRTKYCDNGIEHWVETSGTYALSLTNIIGYDEQGNPIYDENVLAIPCEWSTPLDDDGAPHYFKTLNKKGNLITLLPQIRSSADVTLVKDGIQYKSLDTFWANIFDWAVINFAEFPFTSNITARDDFVKKKVKKYKRLQIVIQNNGIFEPFGLLGITKTYYYGNFAK